MAKLPVLQASRRSHSPELAQSAQSAQSAASAQSDQAGSVIIEGLVALLIFSLGIIGLMMLVGATIAQTSEARYRATASLLAEQVIGDMWSGDTSQVATRFDMRSGEFIRWKEHVEASLPGASMHAPTINFSDKLTATITIAWQAPGAPVHRYIAVTRIEK